MRASVVICALLQLFNHAVKARAEGASEAWDHAHQGDNWEGIGQCGSTERQSPIDIQEDFAADHTDRLMVNWEFDKNSALQVEKTGDSIKASVSGQTGQKGTLKWQGETYDLLQFHFHASSEHTWEGAARDVECHFVHKVSGEDKYAVVGVTFAASHLISSNVDESAFLKAIIDAAPTIPNKGDKSTMTFPLEAGLNVKPVDDFADGQVLNDPPVMFRHARPGVPNDVAGVSDVNDVRVQHSLSSWRDFFHYKGSLTTPPCTPAVNWFVQKRAILAPIKQVEAVHALFQFAHTEGNWRETQNAKSSQELYKVRMAWTPARADPVKSNEQVAIEVQAQTLTCTNEKTEDWVIALCVLLPTLFLSGLITVLVCLAKKNAATGKGDRYTAKATDEEAPKAHSRPATQPAVVN